MVQMQLQMKTKPIHAPITTHIKPKQAKELSCCATFILSGISAITAESITYPLDVLKTRLQVTKHLSPFQITRILFLEEGISKMALGFEAAALRHVFYSGTRVMLFEYLRDHSPIGRNKENGTFPLYKSALCALTSGVIGQFIASPTDFCKVQMQVEGLRELTNEPRLYRNSFHCGRSLYNKYGFCGMWNGCIPNVQRGAFIQIGDLCVYDGAKRFILRNSQLEDNWMAHAMSSVCSGLAATLMCNPFDVVKTRMMNNPGEYRGSLHCFSSVIKKEGFMKLYKGFFPIWGRLGPWHLTFYVTFEKLRRANGLESW